MRGKLGAGSHPVLVLGLIPARAGKTGPRAPRHSPRPAHPRACGENGDGHGGPGVARGSSPRVRGKPKGSSPLAWGKRLIPARAGKTWGSSDLVYTTKAHPRACGENFGFDSRCPFDAGSSPRVRGKLKSEAEITTKVRLIPARAGKTAFVAWRCDVRQAHPRACGENRLSLVRAPPLSGSSPRVRGKLGAGAPGCGGAGLIPARAGKTVVPFLGLVSSAAHPRACGENGTCVKPPGRMSGSSPRVRGKLSTSQATISREGLIPARAGKTHVDDTNPEVAGAHPRACGENGDTLETVASQYGSSPRVRGKPPPVGAQRRRRGLIPARAGKTDCRGRPGL